MSTDGVHTGFELILEELGSVMHDLQREAEHLVKQGNFGKLSKVSATGEALDTFMGKVGALRDEWLAALNQDTRDKIRSEPIAALSTVSEALRLEVQYGEAIGRAEYHGPRDIRILPGSTINRLSRQSLHSGIQALKKKALQKGDIVEAKNPKLYEVRTPQSFKSPSGAAQFIAGCSVSGPRDWRVQGIGCPLQAWLLMK